MTQRGLGVFVDQFTGGNQMTGHRIGGGLV